MTNKDKSGRVVGPEGLAKISESNGLLKGLRDMAVLKRKGDFEQRSNFELEKSGLTRSEYALELLGAGGKNAMTDRELLREAAEALIEFSFFADNVEAVEEKNGVTAYWKSCIHKEQISYWFGPTCFHKARAILAKIEARIKENEA